MESVKKRSLLIRRPSSLERQQKERERLIRAKRDARPMPMMINSKSSASVRRSSPPTARVSIKPVLRGVSKFKPTIVKNERGRDVALRTRRVVQTKAGDCSKVYTSPQEGAICWFAAVFTSMFYSQFIRPVMKIHATNILRNPGHDTTNQVTKKHNADIAGAILEILKGYETGKVSRRVVDYMKPHQFLKGLRAARPQYFTSMVNQSEEAHYGPYQHALLAFLAVPHLSIGIVNGQIKYSGFNVDLPLDYHLWPNAMKTQVSKGIYVDTERPKVIILHKDSGEDYLQSLWSQQRPAIHRLDGYTPSAIAPVIYYNGAKYVLDSTIIGSELRTPSCSVAHAIAGVTCRNERYVYNGWTVKSRDPAMAGSSSVIQDLPCALGKYDWQKNKAFCINASACRFQNARPNQIGKELCFNAVARSSTVYVRASSAKGSYKIGKLVRSRRKM